MGGPGTKFEAVLFKWISSPNQISDVHNHKRCSIRYSIVSIIKAAKVCNGQPGCVTTGACAASTWTCWTSFWPASSSMAATASTARSAAAAPARNAAACAYSTRLGTSDTAEFWKWGKILKMGQNFENWVKFWKLGKMLKIGQNLKNRAKFWKSGKIFEKPGKISKILMRVKCASYSQLLAGTSTNDARASNPAKNWSHKSARHLQKTRARNLRGDTRGLPEAFSMTFRAWKFLTIC